MAEQLEATVIDVFQPKKGEAWGVATVTTGHVSDSVSRQSTRDTISVVGSVGMAKIGEVLVATGRWVDHPTYGRQFKAETVAFKPPTKREPLIRFMASTVSGIGETRAAMIVDHFGTDAMHILDERPDLLRTVPGLPHSLVPKMVEAYKVARCTKHRDILLYLQTAGIGPKLSARIVEKYGERAEEVISEDPYVLMTEFAGVGFVTCDKIADQLGIPANDRRRVRAALVHHITEDCEGQGHTHLQTEGLVDRLGDKMRKTRDVETSVIRTYLKELLDEGTIVFEGGRLYLARTHQTEITVATRLVEIAESRRAVVPGVANEAIAWAEAEDGITLTDEQRAAVLAATAGGLMVATGGPGVGKTVVTRAICRALDNLRISYALCAPTGKAAQRSSEATGRSASTIHRLLGFRGDGFEYNASNQLGAGAVIVDETSMVDLTLARALLVAMRPGTALVLVGDVDQLPSVMPGSVLDDVISSGLATVVRLTTIHRQCKGSAISLAAAAVNAGGRPEGPNPYSEPGAEFAVVPLKESERIADATVDLVLRAREVWGFDPVREVQVITPMKKYASGVIELNRRLQQALNPVKLGVGEVRAHGDAFRPGDKVMQTKNDYQRMVFNGMVGYVVEVDPQSNRLTVGFADDDEVVAYDREDLAHLVLAYASTVHKFQGDQCMAIVMPLDPSHWFMQFRALIYTGVTRARKRCVLVGDVGKAQSRYRAKKRDERITWLASRMREIAATRG